MPRPIPDAARVSMAALSEMSMCNLPFGLRHDVRMRRAFGSAGHLPAGGLAPVSTRWEASPEVGRTS